MSRRHDHDAGGDADVLAAKALLREEMWRRVSVPGIRRFPSPDGRIPNFVGAEAAAGRLAGTSEWWTACTLKANPDSPQLPVRARALEDGKTVFMAVPRLADPEPFFRLDPAALSDPPRRAASIAGARRSARQVAVTDLEPVDLVVTGCVAVGRDGVRLGKGGGFSDLEFALAAAVGLVGPDTVVATTVHAVQLVDPGVVPVTEHDVHVDLVVTPDEVVWCPRPRDRRLPALRRSELTDDKIAVIPVLARIFGDDARR